MTSKTDSTSTKRRSRVSDSDNFISKSSYTSKNLVEVSSGDWPIIFEALALHQAPKKKEVIVADCVGLLGGTL